LPSRLFIRVVVAAACLPVLVGCAPKRVLRQPPPWSLAPAGDGVASHAAPQPRGSGGLIGSPDSRPRDGGPPASVPTAPPTRIGLQLGVQAASLAREQVGQPYRWGGGDPRGGFDCSGLVRWTYGCVGLELPRRADEQKLVGKAIGSDQLRPGDLVFFEPYGSGASHVGVYLGAGRFVHAPRSGEPVREDSLDDPWWRVRWSGSRRVIGD